MSGADFKVVLLGSEDVGKTSLMKRYIQDRFQCRPHQNTIGAAFASRTISTRGRQFVMGIWDTAGSERYYAMSQLYYRDAKAAIVCFDLTELVTFDRAKQWITELRNHEEDCKIYLCGTKKDVVDDGIKAPALSHEKALQYAKGIGAVYMETSSKTGLNVGELFQLIADECVLPSIHNRDDSIKLRPSPNKNNACCLAS
ncbi:ras-related protein Rab-24-like [Frankliniella occidentalis]|uniref:Ras-related protein Rab-24-like n=1 Tax=Frankliniella occidentalis TaxID=133901 RepID=A0A6J1RWK4_FRAOC|nr:ras-related protein Rab-24-like [Frankliniella occidentalis]